MRPAGVKTFHKLHEQRRLAMKISQCVTHFFRIIRNLHIFSGKHSIGTIPVQIRTYRGEYCRSVPSDGFRCVVPLSIRYSVSNDTKEQHNIKTGVGWSLWLHIPYCRTRSNAPLQAHYLKWCLISLPLPFG